MLWFTAFRAQKIFSVHETNVLLVSNWVTMTLHEIFLAMYSTDIMSFLFLARNMLYLLERCFNPQCAIK